MMSSEGKKPDWESACKTEAKTSAVRSRDLIEAHEEIESLKAENLKLQDIIKDRDAQIVEIGARLEYVQEALKK